ncbi:MAG: D-glycerate dehydrogenase, partial [Betaproteobacteria bacterium]|nr:D-glycerate dehydrogenase [Betaproteobacteria bacterium]
MKQIIMKPKIIIARPIFEEVLTHLRQHFDVTDNQADHMWTPAAWTQALSQHDGALTTGADPINAEVLAA